VGLAQRPWPAGGRGTVCAQYPRGQRPLTPSTVHAQYPGLASAAPGQHGAGRQSWPLRPCPWGPSPRAPPLVPPAPSPALSLQQRASRIEPLHSQRTLSEISPQNESPHIYVFLEYEKNEEWEKNENRNGNEKKKRGEGTFAFKKCYGQLNSEHEGIRHCNSINCGGLYKQKNMQISNEGFRNVHCTITVEELHDVFENTPLSST
jgi:hypothetical protein